MNQQLTSESAQLAGVKLESQKGQIHRLYWRSHRRNSWKADFAKKGRYTGFNPVTGFKPVRAQREGERSESETGFERSENDSEASPNLKTSDQP